MPTDEPRATRDADSSSAVVRTKRGLILGLGRRGHRSGIVANNRQPPTLAKADHHKGSRASRVLPERPDLPQPPPPASRADYRPIAQHEVDVIEINDAACVGVPGSGPRHV